MRLFEMFDGDQVDSAIKSEETVVLKSLDSVRIPSKPAGTHSLFEMVEGPVVRRELTPIQQQRYEDGTPHTRGNLTGLRPADPELYLEGVSKSVGPDGVKNDRGNSRPDLDPDTVVKAFLDFEG